MGSKIRAKKQKRPFEAWLAEPSKLTGKQAAMVKQLESDLKKQLAGKERRYRHSLSVGRTAEALARHYGVDPYKARVAGILHDWEKARPTEELIEMATADGVDLGVPLDHVKPLLHGIVASSTLKERYPWLEDDVLQAIARHTSGALDMTPLDKVIFVADGIEPTRGAVEVLDRQRDMVGKATLDELYAKSFTDGITYVVATKRYLYPGSVAIYNQLVDA